MCGVFISVIVCIIFHICLLFSPSTSPILWRLLWKDWQEKARHQSWEPCAYKWSVQPPHLRYCIHVQSCTSLFLLPLLIVYSYFFDLPSLSPSFFSCPLPPFLLLLPPSPPFSAGDSCPVLQSLHVAWATGEDTFPRQHGGHYHPVFLTVDKGCRPLHGVGSVIMFNKRQILYTELSIGYRSWL